ncbi:phage tail protein [Paenibacillus lautus]|uniref:phage tail-collar fiber domain-containing protein n=1 Tax=Paenibacillus lautus TaxID=1401 RepID=UPI003D2D8684
MSSFGAKGLTNKGRVLQAKAQAGVQLKYTKYVLGDAQLGGQSIATLNGVISPKKTVDVTRLKMSPPYESIVGFVLSNQDVTTGFYFRELGLYALDPDEGEILYWYANAGDTADYIPPTNTGDVINKTMDMYVYVGTASNVTLTIDQNLAYVTHDELDEALDGLGTPSGQATGTVVNGNTVYIAALSPALTTLKPFQRVVIKVNVASTGAPTLNPDGLGAKSVLKANGSPASLKANGVYTLVYDGTAFILQGEGGEYGTATAADVLAPKTIGTDNGIITGTMINRTGEYEAVGYMHYAPNNNLYLKPPAGFYKGGTLPWTSEANVYVNEPNLDSKNIKSGVTIFGVQGKSTVVDTADAVLDPNMLVVGYSGYDDGVKKDGQMPNRSAENNHMPGLESTVWAGDRFFIRPPHGYYNGATWVTSPQPGLVASNIRNGVSVGGVVGTLKPNTVGSAIINKSEPFIAPPNSVKEMEVISLPVGASSLVLGGGEGTMYFSNKETYGSFFTVRLIADNSQYINLGSHSGNYWNFYFAGINFVHQYVFVTYQGVSGGQYYNSYPFPSSIQNPQERTWRIVMIASAGAGTNSGDFRVINLPIIWS